MEKGEGVRGRLVRGSGAVWVGGSAGNVTDVDEGLDGGGLEGKRGGGHLGVMMWGIWILGGSGIQVAWGCNQLARFIANNRLIR